MSKYPERCTAIGVRLLKDGRLDIFAPDGLEDIFQYQVRPNIRTTLQQNDFKQTQPIERPLREKMKVGLGKPDGQKNSHNTKPANQ